MWEARGPVLLYKRSMGLCPRGAPAPALWRRLSFVPKQGGVPGPQMCSRDLNVECNNRLGQTQEVVVV